MKVEPGLYWARRKPDNFYDEPDVWIIVNRHEDDKIFLIYPHDRVSYSLVRDCYELGPRLLTPEELEGWTDWPQCPECGERLLHEVTAMPNRGWFCPTPSCGKHMMKREVKVRYRVRKP